MKKYIVKLKCTSCGDVKLIECDSIEERFSCSWCPNFDKIRYENILGIYVLGELE